MIVLVAEVLKHFLPSLVDLHNYPGTLAANKKLVNWHMLNRYGTFKTFVNLITNFNSMLLQLSKSSS